MDTSTIAKAFLEFLRLAPRYLIASGVITGFLVFAEESLLLRIGVFDFVQQYRPIIGLILIVSISLFTISGLADILGILIRWWRKRKFYSHIIDRLNHLNEDEKQILRYYYANQTRANYLQIDDGVVQGLVHDGIIYRSSPMGNLLDGFAHNIDDLAWEYIRANPQILVGNTNTYRTDKRSLSRW